MQNAKNYQYKFSFVIPVYNVEKYLGETIESILSQTMDFDKNCEIIFVNDESPDDSEKICLYYRDKYPNNIRYFKQKNAGPGAARNHGIAEARGRYISLVDSDDKISPNTLSDVYNFFEKHSDDIDVVAIKQVFFEARTGEHPLNYKFARDRVIDLNKDYDNIQMSITSSFFKNEVLQKHKFKESVGRYAEDSHLMGRIMLDKQKFGVVSRPIYFYRKRNDQASSLDATITDPFWYLETPKRAWRDLLDYARKNNEKIPKFIQFMVMYDLQWRIKQSVQTVLNEKQCKEYKLLIYGLLGDIDDDVIMRQHQIKAPYKIFALDKKYGVSVLVKSERHGSKYYYKGTEIYNWQLENPALRIEFIERTKAGLRLEGYFDGILIDDLRIAFRAGEKLAYSEPVDRPHRAVTFLGDVVLSGRGFVVDLVLKPGYSVEPAIQGISGKPPIITHRFSRLSQSAPLSYCTIDDLLLRKHQNYLSVEQRSSAKRFIYEIVFWGALAKRLRLRATIEKFIAWRWLHRSGTRVSLNDLRWLLIPAKATARNLYTICFRIVYFVARLFVKRPIWILSDRIVAADDSGEILFRYLWNHKDVPAKIYFMISSSSSDYKRLRKEFGRRVLNFHSLRYKLKFLLADKIISSEATDHVINAFGGRMDDLVDLYNFDFVFLQHGIMRDDISAWLNRSAKNIKLFVTSSAAELQAILDEAYGYGDEVVKLTGLPRYDNMDNQPQGKIILAPTWRAPLVGPINPANGERKYNPKFKNSEYFYFYQKLMNDERLQKVMAEYGMTGEFYLHHSFQAQLKDFKGNKLFSIIEPPLNYPEARSKANLLITDYSSISFDFAYLNKPVIYAQFDKAEYYAGTSDHKESFFIFERDGFGPVVTDYGSTLTAIIDQIKRGCIMSKEYQENVSRFFAFHDRDNSRRVYEKILEMK